MSLQHLRYVLGSKTPTWIRACEIDRFEACEIDRFEISQRNAIPSLKTEPHKRSWSAEEQAVVGRFGLQSIVLPRDQSLNSADRPSQDR